MKKYQNPIELLIHSTVRIECSDGQGNISYGSGYIFNFCQNDDKSVPCIITNNHVVSGNSQGIFHLTRKNADGNADLENHERIELSNLQKHCIHHPNKDIDLVAILIGVILNNAFSNGKDYYYISLDLSIIASDDILSTLSSMEEIVMIGYPNGIWDSKHNLPIIRKGITATHPKLSLNGKPEFLIDAACFPGSSGSPVFLANIGSFVDASGALCAGSRVSLLGTLYAGPQHTATGEVIVVNVPTGTKSMFVGGIPNNLGLVIHAKELLSFESLIKVKMNSPSIIPRNSPCPCSSGKKYKECCGSISR